MLFLAAFLAVAGLIMMVTPTGFGRLAHSFRASVPPPTPVSAKVARAMGLAVFAAGILVLIAYG